MAKKWTNQTSFPSSVGGSLTSAPGLNDTSGLNEISACPGSETLPKRSSASSNRPKKPGRRREERSSARRRPSPRHPQPCIQPESAPWTPGSFTKGRTSWPRWFGSTRCPLGCSLLSTGLTSCTQRSSSIASRCPKNLSKCMRGEGGEPEPTDMCALLPLLTFPPFLSPPG